MFDSNDLTRDYERILLKVFENEAIDEDDFSGKKIPIREAYIELKTLVNNSNQNNPDQSAQIKDDYYFLDVAMSERSKCDFYVFVCVGARIVVFKNDKSKMIFKKDGVLIHKDLLHKEKFYDG